MLDIDKFCRLCLTEEGVATHLFDGSPENTELPMCKKVMRCIAVKIQLGDGLPARLCQKCADRVNNFWLFKELTEQVDVALQNILKTNVDDSEHDAENKIKSLAQKSLTFLTRTREKETLNVNSLKVLPAANVEKDSFTSRINNIKVEAVLNDDANNDWSDSPYTPLSASPLSSSPSLEPTSLKNAIDDGFTQEVSPQKKEKKKKKNIKRKVEYICEFCGRKFLRSNHLAQHELTHVVEKPFHCSDCSKSFWYKASLIGHIKQTHSGDVNYSCDVCGKGFYKKTELSRHKPTHSNETPHKCPQCGLGFKIEKTLKRHIRTVHTAQRSHTCHTCGKSFTQYQTLKVHMLLHTGEKPHVCSHCGKGFAQSAPLKTHIRLHTGERPYKCHKCGDCFATRSGLVSHASKHVDMLPYPCSKCEESFRLKRDLVRHEQAHVDLESRLSQFPAIKEEPGEGQVCDDSACENQLQTGNNVSQQDENQFQNGNGVCESAG